MLELLKGTLRSLRSSSPAFARKLSLALASLIVTAGLTLFAGHAFADGSDLAAVPSQWKCYGGGSIGVVTQSSNADIDGDFFTSSIEAGDYDAGYGVIVGCDVEMNDVFIGVFGDYRWQSVKAQETVSFLVPTINSSSEVELGNQYSLGARLGTIVSIARPYIQAGLTWTEIETATSESFIVTFTETLSETEQSWFVGGGIDVDLPGPFTVGMDYRYTAPSVEGVDVSSHSVFANLKFEFGSGRN